MNLSQWLGILSIILIGLILWQIRQILLFVFLVIVITIALNRLVQFIQQRLHLQRNYAVILTLSTTALGIILFFLLVVPPFLEQFQILLTLSPTIWLKIQNGLIILQNQDFIQGLPESLRNKASLEALPALIPRLFQNFFTFFSNSAITTLSILFVITLTVMMLWNPQAYRQQLLKLLPSFYRRRADEILSLSESALGNWLTGIAISSCFIALLSGLGLWTLQIKLVLVHALMAGILNFIPNIGPAASVVFPIMIALLDEPWKIGAVLVLYFIIQNVESYWLTPTIMAKQVSLLPAVTLMAQLFFASVFGLFGLILALPLTVVAKTWLEETLFKDVLDQWT
ncbi:MAG: AI-2E family transporter [Microcystaceae cyanobacterium]